MPANAYDAILKMLLNGQPTEAAIIASTIGLSTTDTVTYLMDLLARGFVTYDGNPIGSYSITDAGRFTASRSATIVLALFQETIQQPDPATTGVALELTPGVVTFASKATFACGCIAYVLQPAAINLGLRVAPCEAHQGII